MSATPALNVTLLDAADRVRTVYIHEHAEAAAKVASKLRRVTARVAVGQTQLTGYQATLARQLRVLTAGERRDDLDVAA